MDIKMFRLYRSNKHFNEEGEDKTNNDSKGTKKSNFKNNKEYRKQLIKIKNSGSCTIYN